MTRLFILILFVSLSTACREEPKTTSSLAKIKRLQKTPTVNSADQLDVITFGSCSRHDEKQPLWKSIAEEEPDLWIWSGDNIYGDTEDMSLFESKYTKQLLHPAYQRFVERVPIIGTWDDHDYGVNDGGKNYPKKKETRDLMFEFLGVPKDNPAWDREGAYQSYIYGPAEKRVKIILLDARYFRDDTKRSPDRKSYTPTTGDVLGEAQWSWFEKELIGSEANLNVIVSGIQMIPEDHKYEKWANFPLSRDRLFNLIKSSKSNTILISGDRHIGEISAIEQGDRTLYEITSSGLTHSYDSFSGEENQHRVSNVVSSLNYGKLTIDWDADPISVTGEIKGIGGKDYEKIAFDLK